MKEKIKDELRIRRVANDVLTTLQILAQNEGVNLSAFMKPHLRRIVDSYPEEMKKKKQLDY